MIALAAAVGIGVAALRTKHRPILVVEASVAALIVVATALIASSMIRSDSSQSSSGSGRLSTAITQAQAQSRVLGYLAPARRSGY